MHSARKLWPLQHALATRWVALAAEIDGHDNVLDAITAAAAPTLREAFGIGADSAAEMMIVVGDNPLPPQYCYLKPSYLDVNTSYFDHLERGAL